MEGGSHWVGIGRMVRIGILKLCNKIPYSVGWRKDGSRFGTSHNMHHNKGWKVGHWVGNSSHSDVLTSFLPDLFLDCTNHQTAQNKNE